MLSNSCRYGIRAIIYLASQPAANGKTGIKQISEALDLPQPFLAKILQKLAKEKILSSSKGPHGGFGILKDPQTITLLDIVNSIDGSDIFTNCVMHNGSCKTVGEDQRTCPLHDDYDKIRTDQVRLFSNKTIFELVKSATDTRKIVI